jgi:hypothetical protein
LRYRYLNEAFSAIIFFVNDYILDVKSRYRIILFSIFYLLISVQIKANRYTNTLIIKYTFDLYYNGKGSYDNRNIIIPYNGD